MPTDQATIPALSDVYAARRRIASLVCRTPLVPAHRLSAEAGGEVVLKLETLQDTGAFKLRGATNLIAQLDADQRARGVVAVSTGNHGRAVAYAARRLDIDAVVCMSELVPENKRKAIRDLGAEVKITGRSQDEAQVEAERLVSEQGRILVHPFDDPLIVAGQGTIGLELMEDRPDLDTVLVGLSGGGLMAGIALAVKQANPLIRVVAVSMERGPAMYDSVRAGRPIDVEELPTLADSLGGGIGLENRCTFRMVRELVDDYVLLSEREIAEGMRFLYREERLVTEGAAAVGAAAILSGKVDVRNRRTACIVTGNNVDMDTFTDIVTGQHAVWSNQASVA